MLLAEKSEEKTGEHTVSEVLINQIAAWGVQYVFGIPGTSTLGIVDAIRKSNGKVKYVQVRHEETAAFMASAYGKLTGHVAACLGISGPGATNLVTGLVRCAAGSFARFGIDRHGSPQTDWARRHPRD